MRWQVLGEAYASALAPSLEQLFPVSLCVGAADQPWTTSWPAEWNTCSAWCKVTTFSEVVSIWCTCRLRNLDLCWCPYGSKPSLKAGVFTVTDSSVIGNNPFISQHYRRCFVLNVMSIVIWLFALLRWNIFLLLLLVFKEELQEGK